MHGRRSFLSAGRAVVLVWALALCAGTAGADPYRLGAGDQVRLIVLEDPQLSGTYAISETGTVAIPVGKPVLLQGLTLEEAAETVRKIVATRLVDPTVSLDIAQIRPFYIVGDVARPGPYPGQVRLNLAKAVAIAGGFRDRSEIYQASVTGIRAQESLIVARRQLLAGKVQLARLEAELAGSAAFTYAPPDANGEPDPDAGEIVRREQDLFTVRKTGLKRQLDLLAKEASVREDEMAALRARIDQTAKQLDLLKVEIDTVQDLVNRGLAPVSRIYQLNREESAVLSSNLQTTVLLNQARQARNQLEIQMTSLPRDRRIEVLAGIQDATGNIDRLNRQIAADRNVLQESSDFGFAGSGSQVTRVFRIQHEDGSVAENVRDQTAAVLPGDVIEVRRELPQD